MLLRSRLVMDLMEALRYAGTLGAAGGAAAAGGSVAQEGEAAATCEEGEVVKLTKSLLLDATRLDHVVDNACVPNATEEDKQRADTEATMAIQMLKNLGISIELAAADMSKAIKRIGVT